MAEETLKIIVALVCIIFLAYLIFAIYDSSSSDKKIEQAKNVLLITEDNSRSVEAIVLSLREGESETKDISSPSGWYFYSFVGQEKPNSCLNQRCLCICDNVLIESISSQASKCDKKGVCLAVPNLAASELNFKINKGNVLFLKIKKESGRIFIEEE